MTTAHDTIHITRKELYDQVWSEPLIQLAKKYGISNTGLKKRCKKLQIPLPHRGYWAKKRFGKEPPRPLLCPYSGPEQVEFRLKKSINRPVDCEQLKKAQACIAFEKDIKNKICVSSSLRSLHTLVAETKKILSQYKPVIFEGAEPILYVGNNPALNIKVSKKSLARALCIMNALLKALERRGFLVFIETRQNYSNHQSSKTCVSILGEVIEIRLLEMLRQIQRELPASEWWWKQFLFTNVLSGELSLQILSWDSPRKNWNDGKEQRIENCLNSFIIGLINAAVEKRTRQNERGSARS